MELKDKKVLITGAARGIGYLLALEFFKKGAKLILIDKDEETLKELENTFKEKGKTYVADLSSEIQVNALIEKLKEEEPSIDILINNAGVGIYKNIKTLNFDEWRDSFFINVYTPFLLTKGLLKVLVNSKQPVVLNIGSVSAGDPEPKRVPYNATKAALRMFSLCTSEDLRRSKIKVGLITLGSTLTEFGPLNISDKIKLQEKGKKYLRPDFVARKIVSILENDEVKDEIVINA